MGPLSFEGPGRSCFQSVLPGTGTSQALSTESWEDNKGNEEESQSGSRLPHPETTVPDHMKDPEGDSSREGTQKANAARAQAV